jgi:formylmethanofuran dehydrogenase subunit E
MKARKYKKFENATPNVASHWLFRLICKHEFVGHRLDEKLFEREYNHLYITCKKCGEQYISKDFFD